MANATREQIRIILQIDSGVPSSYNWNPTNPLISKQVTNALLNPFWMLTKYGNGPLAEQRQHQQPTR